MGQKDPNSTRLAKVASLTFAWYATSILCTNGTKALQSNTYGIDPMSLTMIQLSVSVPFAASATMMLHPGSFSVMTTGQVALAAVLAVTVVAGFGLLNLPEAMPSTVMVMRALEPVFAFFLSDKDRGGVAQGLSLALVGGGALLTVSGDVSMTIEQLVISSLCNVCFVLRGVLTKRIKAKYATNDFLLFSQVCAFGAVAQAGLIAAASSAGLPGAPRLGDIVMHVNGDLGRDLFLNATFFFMYLQLSWIVLSEVSVVMHSLLNSVRRPVIIVASAMYFAQNLTVRELVGIATACAGACVYGIVSKSKRSTAKGDENAQKNKRE